MALNKNRWEPLRRATSFAQMSDADIDTAVRASQQSGRPMTREEIVAALASDREAVEYWVNHLYQVAKRRLRSPNPEMPDLIHLNIRRRDGGVIMRDWRHFQWIKNQLVGEECEGVELYPAESRLSDTSNKYHIWCIDSTEFRFPFGMNGRDVSDISGEGPGLQQRPFRKDGS